MRTGGRTGRAAAMLLAGLGAVLVAGMLAVGPITSEDGTSCGSLASPSRIDGDSPCQQSWKVRLGFTVTLAVMGVGLLIGGAAVLDSPVSDDE